MASGQKPGAVPASQRGSLISAGIIVRGFGERPFWGMSIRGLRLPIGLGHSHLQLIDLMSHLRLVAVQLENTIVVLDGLSILPLTGANIAHRRQGSHILAIEQQCIGQQICRLAAISKFLVEACQFDQGVDVGRMPRLLFT